MSEGPPPGRAAEVPLLQLLPNMLTIVAICAGLSAIRFGIEGDFQLAARLVVAACILDALDGRLARALGGGSKIGAELDSLADFLNFGVAPPLLLYFWALQDGSRAGWLGVLVFAVCCVLRLARFNVGNKAETGGGQAAYFVGVPAPAGAMLVLLPMFHAFATGAEPGLPPLGLGLYMMLIGLLMISRIPTWSFKTTAISRGNVGSFLAAFAFLGAALLTFAWVTLVVLCLGYVATVVWGLLLRPGQPGAD